MLTQLTLILIPLPFAAFWLWMFQDMSNNDYLPRETRLNWTLAFIFANIFAAAYYYFDIYRNRS